MKKIVLIGEKDFFVNTSKIREVLPLFQSIFHSLLSSQNCQKPLLKVVPIDTQSKVDASIKILGHNFEF